MNVRIFELVNSMGLGGTEKTFQIYCKYLYKKNFDIFAGAFLEGGPREKIVKPYVLDIIFLKKNVDRLKRYLINNKIDVLHWHNIPRKNKEIEEDVIGLLRFCNLNNIIVVETSPFSSYHKIIDNMIDRRIFVSKANLLKYIYKFGKKINNPDKLMFLYNPLDLEEMNKYSLSPVKRAEIRKKYGIAKGDFVIGRVGRADIWKWDDAILDIVPLLIQAIPNLKVVVRSMPKEKVGKIRKMGIEKYFVILPETVGEKYIAETYQLMDILVHSSRIGECNSVAIDEAMFFGLPVITNSTDFMQFTIFDRDNGQVELIDNGKNGYIENIPNKMAQRIINLYSNKKMYNSVSNNNIKKAISLFDANKVIDQFVQVLLHHKGGKLNIRVFYSKYRNAVVRDSLIKLLRININAFIDLLKIKYVWKNL